MRLDFVKTGRLAVLLAGTALAAAFATTPARADIAGTLTCNVAGGTGAIIGSQRALSCTFMSANGPAELYTGTLSRLGVDIGTLNAGTLVFQVVELGTPAPGALAGAYVGPGFGITIGSGGGIDGLVGGSANSISLQPIAATTSSGLNINAGVGALQLAYAGPAGGGMGMHHRHHHGFYRPHHHRHHHHAM